MSSPSHSSEFDPLAASEPGAFLPDYTPWLRAEQGASTGQGRIHGGFYHGVMVVAFLLTVLAAYLLMTRAFSEPVEPVVAFWFGVMMGAGAAPLVQSWVYPRGPEQQVGQRCSLYADEPFSEAAVQSGTRRLHQLQARLREQAQQYDFSPAAAEHPFFNTTTSSSQLP
jgi:hypothetical protein